MESITCSMCIIETNQKFLKKTECKDCNSERVLETLLCSER